MKIVRFSDNGIKKYGVWQEETILGYQGSPFSEPALAQTNFRPDGSIYNLAEVRLLVPCEPSKIVCLGLNYMPHIEEKGFATPKLPILFLKPTTALIGPEEYVIKPNLPGPIDYEGELGVVIGKKAKDVAESEALEYILGYTCVNDVSARNAQEFDGQWTRGKGFDTFCPLGPCIETEGDPRNLKIETYLNEQLRQSGNTGDVIFGIQRVISFISEVMTLNPGDVIATGTPSGIGEMNAGDVVEIRIEGVGTLRHFVKDKI